ncbi:MAG: methyltransferase domain-containing protein [Polyangiaceae bacterium]|nr:methyltransferase domain-containing protein [Polyangiaceae bacterium]
MSSARPASVRAWVVFLALSGAVVGACMATGRAGDSGGQSALDDVPAAASSERTQPATASPTAVKPTDRAGVSQTKASPRTSATSDPADGTAERSSDARDAPDDSAASPSFGAMPDVDYWATPQPVVDRMLELARVKATDLVYDLGCGDARSLVTAAERYGAKGVGFDIDPKVVALARENVRRHGVENLVRIEQANIFTLDLSPADVVFLYLTPRLNWRLVPQLEKLRRGSRIVVHEYEIPGARPLRIVKMRGPPDGPPGTELEQRTVTHTIYLWKVPWQKQPTDWTEADRATDPDQGR